MFGSDMNGNEVRKTSLNVEIQKLCPFRKLMNLSHRKHYVAIGSNECIQTMML